MIRVQCSGCGSQLNAKEKLAGQTRKCPKCGAAITIPKGAADVPVVTPDSAEPPAEPTPIIHANPATTRLPSKTYLERLGRSNRYVICDKTMVVATWRNDGKGWMVRGASGFLAARRNAEALAPHGFFVLVELEMADTDEGNRLVAINSYQLAKRFAMPKLAAGEDEIVHAVSGPGCLNREQKFAVREALKNQFMREVWGHSSEVLDYLSNADYHSSTSRQDDSTEEDEQQ